VINAAKAAGNGPGHVRVSLDLAPADAAAHRVLPIGWQPAASLNACLTVADNNGGMAPEIMDKIFDPFFSTKFTGRGLGLPVTLGVVKTHQGAISIANEPGKGTVFRVFLPILARQAAIAKAIKKP